MKKTIIALIVLFLISAFTAVISLAVCGVELVSSAVEYGVEEYREYRTEDEVTVNSTMMLANNNFEADGVVCPICGETECRLDCEKERDCPYYEDRNCINNGQNGNGACRRVCAPCK